LRFLLERYTVDSLNPTCTLCAYLVTIARYYFTSACTFIGTQPDIHMLQNLMYPLTLTFPH